VDTFFSAFPFANFTRDDSLLPLLVGNGPENVTAFDGVLDEIRIVKRVLTAAEVLDLFNGVK
jgi:hypothetical protein